MDVSRFFKALWANLLLIGGLFALYVVLVLMSLLFKTERKPAPPLDVVFVFDTTGSMQDEIDGLLRISSRFAATLDQSGSDYRVGMVSFGERDAGQPIRQVYTPDKNLPTFQAYLRGTHAQGGGEEDQLSAITYPLDKFTPRANAKQILILITDEPLYGNETTDDAARPLADWNKMIERVADAKVTAYAVTIPEEYYKALADRTGGKYYDISRGGNFMDILMGIAQDINANLTK